MLAGPGFWDLEIARAGWSRAPSPSPAAFPELIGRAAVWGRNLYSRGGDRLVIEWSDPVTLSAVLLNGTARQVDSAEALAALVHRGR
ncbi:hypothetical protein OG455_38680 [Kitasatospora sp. NBC_01287]|uniref:hypothetical protein n=1 Tax=Kitasatospora sp. NBC_01287 TaxID=2903573 RepID=UPI002258650C|nr:hypothetical protein [Kitasatospora sp. NBC_01287]MCX4751363.1 hypothetical protein [Kitasatospora sp. NBC_01287]